MSDRINELVSAIREKASHMHGQLSTERSANSKLREEIETIKSDIISKNSEIDALKSKLIDLENNMNTTEKQDVIGSKGNVISNEQIDELVKEIEYCLGQLKK